MSGIKKIQTKINTGKERTKRGTSQLLNYESKHRLKYGEIKRDEELCAFFPNEKKGV